MATSTRLPRVDREALAARITAATGTKPEFVRDGSLSMEQNGPGLAVVTFEVAMQMKPADAYRLLYGHDAVSEEPSGGFTVAVHDTP